MVNNSPTSTRLAGEFVGLRRRLDCIFANWNLLGNPFFDAWRNGELPLETIRLFAEDFGTVIKLIPRGWKAVGDREHGQESLVHIAMWDSFCKCLNTWPAAEPKLAEVGALAESSKRIFSSKYSALGGLYAIDLLFNGCAAVLKEGLQAHYRQLDQSLYEEFFDIHASDSGLICALANYLDSCSEEGHRQVISACEETCELLWHSLNAINGTAIIMGAIHEPALSGTMSNFASGADTIGQA